MNVDRTAAGRAERERQGPISFLDGFFRVPNLVSCALRRWKLVAAFAVAGADGKFVWAEAKIDGKTVIVRAPGVKEPKFVRYAYAGYRGDANLQNAEGLPAYPFRSSREH